VVQAPPAQMDSIYGIATVFDLEQNFPNPFNSVTQFWISVPKWERVRLEVYDVLGRRVRTLLNREMLPGRYRLSWDGRDDAGKPVASGMYFVWFSSENQIKVRKVLLLR
jgi:flagellar hook assembly protein FlgD